jgi:hypothetical protein
VEAFGPADLKRCTAIALVVGTILVSINQGLGAFVEPPPSALVAARMALNYCVPFSVASVSAVLANRARGRTSATR